MLTKPQHPGDTIALDHTDASALESMFEYMYEGHYELHHGDDTIPLLELVRQVCEHQDDMYEMATTFRVHGLDDLALKYLREHVNTAIFESDTIKHVSFALEGLGVVVKAGYRDMATLDNSSSGTMVVGADMWPNRAVAREAAVRLWGRSKDMEDEDDRETAESVVRKGLVVLCCNIPVFGQEFAIYMLGDKGVRMRTLIDSILVVPKLMLAKIRRLDHKLEEYATPRTSSRDLLLQQLLDTLRRETCEPINHVLGCDDQTLRVSHEAILGGLSICPDLPKRRVLAPVAVLKQRLHSLPVVILK
jgi:hypothetical protein